MQHAHLLEEILEHFVLFLAIELMLGRLIFSSLGDLISGLLGIQRV